MQTFLIGSLDAVAQWARMLALIAFLGVNLFFVGGVLLRRSAGFVNRWTSSWLAVNLAALALGAGVPLATGLMKMAVGTVPQAPAVQSVTAK
jgi:hypothetical protein